MSITYSIVEDDRETREAIVALLAANGGFELTGAYRTGEAALKDLPRNPPALVLVDINLPGMSGLACTVHLRSIAPDLPVLVLTTYAETDTIFEALRAGACGYLLKKRLTADLAPAMEQAVAGGAPMSMEIARKVVEHFHHAAPTPGTAEIDRLSAREFELLGLLAEGCLYKEIGDQMSLSYHTVRAHIRNIYKKLHVQSRAHATLKYLEHRGRK